MKRYKAEYQRNILGDHLLVSLRVTRWGRIANWLHLPTRQVAEFVETFNADI